MPKFNAAKRIRLKGIIKQSYPELREIFEPTSNFGKLAENTDGVFIEELYHQVSLSTI